MDFLVQYRFLCSFVYLLCQGNQSVDGELRLQEAPVDTVRKVSSNLSPPHCFQVAMLLRLLLVAELLHLLITISDSVLLLVDGVGPTLQVVKLGHDVAYVFFSDLLLWLTVAFVELVLFALL